MDLSHFLEAPVCFNYFNHSISECFALIVTFLQGLRGSIYLLRQFFPSLLLEKNLLTFWLTEITFKINFRRSDFIIFDSFKPRIWSLFLLKSFLCVAQHLIFSLFWLCIFFAHFPLLSLGTFFFLSIIIKQGPSYLRIF